MGKKRVLVIDDEPLLRRALADYLRECGYHASTAADGAEGLNSARAEHFDVVLVDLRMPRVDGLEVVATLKAEQPELPVVVVSGTGVLQDVIEAVRRGAWDYVTKPVRDMDEITVIIERVLERARLIAERDRYQQEIEDLNRQLGVTVARQTEDLRAQNRELTALNHIISAADATLDPLEILRVLCTELALALSLPHASATLAESDGLNLKIAAEYCRYDRESLLGRTIAMTEPSVAYVLQHQLPLFIEDAQDDSRLGDYLAGIRRRQTATLLLAPVVVRGRVMSILGLETVVPRTYDDHDTSLIVNAAAAAGQALEALNLHRELREHADALETTVAQRTAELSVALEQAQAADKAKSQFLSSVSHELRTPLASIRLYLGLLSQGRVEHRQRYLESLAREVERLQVLIEELLDISRLDLEKTIPQWQPVDLNALLATLAEDRTRLFTERGLHLHLDTVEALPSIPADPALLEQVATNLLTNALNYTQPGGDVWLSTTAVTHKARPWVVFKVRDNGPGIAPEEQQQLFQRFYRGEAARVSKAPGTGLGLAISQGIVSLHHGRITLESDLGKGSTFCVWLPCEHSGNAGEMRV
jgi:signal transduction histidine kinase/DNA-binding response OmpR family regulator